MAVPTGQEFLIESITSTEVKVHGGTSRTWVLHGHPSTGACVQVSEEWYKAFRPKIDGWLVFMYDPAQPHLPAFPNYETPSKHEARMKKRNKR